MLSSLLSGTSRRLGRQLHTQKVGNVNTAGLERYSVIRKFFRQQHILTLQSLQFPSRTITTYPRRTTLLARSPHRNWICPARLFLHSSWSKSFATNTETPEKKSQESSKNAEPSDDAKAHPPGKSGISEPQFSPPRDYENYSRFFRRLAMSLPHAHRPTRDELLSVATNFWQRLRIRFKWFTVRSFRKFNADDISAFVTWFVMSQTLWILIGTCVGFSILVYFVSYSIVTQNDVLLGDICNSQQPTASTWVFTLLKLSSLHFMMLG